MNWEEVLKAKPSLNVLQKQIKGNSNLWLTFANVDAMNDYLESILQFGNINDVNFRRECIDFVINVFSGSSEEIRRCIFSSSIMRGVYDLIAEDPSFKGFDEIITFSERVHEWRDLRSGIRLLSIGKISIETIEGLLSEDSERDLADVVSNELITESTLDSLLSMMQGWNDWASAIRIIDKYPNSLKHDCLIDITSRQPEKVLDDLSNEKGVRKEYIRKIVLKRGRIDNWEYILNFLSKDIILSGDTVFQNVAIYQNCRELFALYSNEYVNKEDLRVIISRKGFWDDLESVEILRKDEVIDIKEEEVILTAIERGKPHVIENMIIDGELLSRVIDFWEEKNRSICPDFPSILWSHLLRHLRQGRDNYIETEIDSSIIESIASLSDDSSLKVFFIRLYASQGERIVAGFIGALLRGELFSRGFIENYRKLTDSTDYIPLSTISHFKNEYLRDIRVIQAASKIGLFSSEEGNALSVLASDLLVDDNAFGEKYNSRYFRNVEEHAQPKLDGFYDSYIKLNGEQKTAVLSDEDSLLVVSSAGSGKTRVIVSKYEYLSKVKGLKEDSIRILAYTRATRKEINQEKLGRDPDKGPARTFHSFANEIIELSEAHPQYLKDIQKAANGRDIDHSPRAAVLYTKMIKDGIEKNDDFMNALSLYAVSYKSNKLKDRNRNLSFYTDRDGKIGCLKSYQEKVIFDFLADNTVDFAYENKSDDGNANPDFTIYYNNKSIYYEHFAVNPDMTFSPYGAQYLSDAKRKIEQWGDNLIYTTGANIGDTDEILEQLKNKLDTIGVELHRVSSEDRTKVFRMKKNYQEIFQSGIKMCLDIYDIIRESRIQMKDAFDRCSGNEYANTFMSVLFTTVKTYYDALLKPDKTSDEKLIDYTGCIEYASELCSSGVVKSIPWDYILIDEYQDISPLRFEFIKSLRAVNPKLKICAVGDDWQSIYSFANSDLLRFKGFEEDWPFSRAIMMTETFRFNNPLLHVSTSFLRKGKDPLLLDKEVKASIHSPNVTNIEIKQCNDFNHQIRFIRKTIEDRRLNPMNCLILARYNSDLEVLRRSCFDDNQNNSDTECIMTMHASKGLTREYVFLVNCNEGVIPSQVEDDTVIKLIRNSSVEAKINEERRLFYVAITRASVKTFVLYSGTPSRFVRELEEIIKS